MGRGWVVTTIVTDVWFFMTYYSVYVIRAIGAQWFLITYSVVLIAMGITLFLDIPLSLTIGFIATVTTITTVVIGGIPPGLRQLLSQSPHPLQTALVLSMVVYVVMLLAAYLYAIISCDTTAGEVVTGHE